MDKKTRALMAIDNYVRRNCSQTQQQSYNFAQTYEPLNALSRRSVKIMRQLSLSNPMDFDKWLQAHFPIRYNTARLADEQNPTRPDLYVHAMHHLLDVVERWIESPGRQEDPQTEQVITSLAQSYDGHTSQPPMSDGHT